MMPVYCSAEREERAQGIRTWWCRQMVLYVDERYDHFLGVRFFRSHAMLRGALLVIHMILFFTGFAIETRLPNTVYEEHFKDWQSIHGIVFSDPLEYRSRLRIFSKNHDLIERHNAPGNASFRLGHNEFSHMTWQEFAAQFMGFNASPAHPGTPAFDAVASEGRTQCTGERVHPSGVDDCRKGRGGFQAQERIPITNIPFEEPQSTGEPLSAAEFPELPLHSMNWVERGAVTVPGRQRLCGSCWAFSAIGAIEGAMFAQTGQLTPLSVQQMLSCVQRNRGCKGGRYDHAFHWARSNGGVCLERLLPYQGRQTACAEAYHSCEPVPGSAPRSFAIPKSWFGFVNDEDEFIRALNRQPVAVTIQPSNSVWWQFYSGGIIDPDAGHYKCGQPSGTLTSVFSAAKHYRHAVLAVGYGYARHWLTRKVTLYWIVKNSWGTSWGEGGFIRIKRSYGRREQGCGILDEPIYPVL